MEVAIAWMTTYAMFAFLIAWMFDVISFNSLIILLLNLGAITVAILSPADSGVRFKAAGLAVGLIPFDVLYVVVLIKIREMR